jgi:hypothetical protein
MFSIGRYIRGGVVRTAFVVPALVFAMGLASCGKGEVPYDTNLLKNPSFEDVKNGIPEHWTLASYRGLEGQPEVTYGVDRETAADGKVSWRFSGDPGTRRWYVLRQELEVQDITQVRLQGWMQTEGVERREDQFPESNFILNFYDANHNRFQELRFEDKRTRPETGTLPWVEKNLVFRVPKGTRYVAVSCILGCSGTAWFDNVRLSIPQPLGWQTKRTKNFVFYSLPERPFPAGSVENEQLMFDTFADLLGIKTDMVVSYYLYPDTTSLRKALSIKGHEFVDHEDREIHSINPNEDHEIIHFMTDPLGVPPRPIYEGTVFWLQGIWYGKPIHEVAAKIQEAPRGLPPMKALVNSASRRGIDANIWIPTAASFVGYLVNRWGAEQLVELYRTPIGRDSYESFAKAFEKVYGMTCEDAEEQWHAALANPDVRHKLK